MAKKFIEIENGLYIKIDSVLVKKYKDKIDNFRINEGRSNWYGLECWEPTFGCRAIALIASEDNSEAYEMHRAEVFLLANGQFALVTESGCSCYESRDAVIDLYPTEEIAVEQMKKWIKRYEYEDSTNE